jgi:hypothetical protein
MGKVEGNLARPPKRGLAVFAVDESQTFGGLARVRRENLAKRCTAYDKPPTQGFGPEAIGARTLLNVEQRGELSEVDLVSVECDPVDADLARL